MLSKLKAIKISDFFNTRSKVNYIIRFILIFILVSIFSYIAFTAVNKQSIGIDDANITFVYAKNLASGNGLVYNVGGERVEGFTSFLWVLITSVFFKIFHSPEKFIIIFNILAITVSLTFLSKQLDKIFERLRRTNKLYKESLFPGIPTLILLSWIFATPSFIAWSVLSLMEVGILSTLLMLTIGLIFKIINNKQTTKLDIIIFLILILCLYLVRPENLILNPILILLFCIADYYNSNKLKQSIRYFLILIASLVVIAIGMTLFRLSYFGYPLPNTYYAKVSPDIKYNISEGLTYLNSFLESNIFVRLIFITTVLSILFILGRIIFIFIRQRKLKLDVQDFLTIGISLIVLMAFLLPVWNGGDHFQEFRFYQHIWPFLIIQIILFLEYIFHNQLFISNNFTKYEILISSLIIFPVLFYTANIIQWNEFNIDNENTIGVEFKISKYYRNQGYALNDFFKDNLPKIGVLTAGGVRMTYQGEIVDLMGLNNVLMAHSQSAKKGVKNHAAFDIDTFYILKPDTLLADFTNSPNLQRPLKPIKDEFWYTAYKGIVDEVKFKELYTEAVISKGNKYMYGYFLNDYLMNLGTDYTIDRSYD